MISKAISDLKSGTSLYPMWIFQAYHNLSARYKRTFLGSLWIASGMLSISLCVSLIVGGMFGQNLAEVLPYIMGGILVFQLAGYIVMQAPEVFVANGGIIKNHAYPYTFYVYEGVANCFMQFLHNLVVYLLFNLAIGAFKITSWTIVLGLPVVIVSMFTWGTVIGLLSARFRDLRFMIPFIGNLLFYLTPIMWRPDQMHGGKEYIAYVNPFYGLVEIVRAPLMGLEAPGVAWMLALGTMFSGILVWLIVFPAFRRRIPFWV
jgi:ABC-type polysaccharide/polyol phosphate export permease